jgi:hypothetical protein
MAPTIVVAAASAPTVMMATTAVSHMAVTITSLDLDDSSIGTAKSARCRGGYCRRRQGWNYCKCAGGKSDQQKPFHFNVSSIEFALSRQGRKFWELSEFHQDAGGYCQLRRLLLWRYPSLSHGTFDDVPLNSFALRTSKRSQVLVQRVRLNRRQPHRRTASRALRTLVLCIEHVLLLNLSLSSAP